MILTNVRDTIRADSLAFFELNIEILLTDVTQARKVEHFDFDLTRDVTGDPEVIKICFPSTIFPGLSNASCIFRIGPVVSESRGGLEIDPSDPGDHWGYKNSPSVIKIPQWGEG